jgi:hypothetical protein
MIVDDRTKLDVLPDPEEMNDQRSDWAGDALYHYSNEHGEDDADQQNLSELLCNLAHWCDRNGVSFATALTTAEVHYNEETDHKGKQFE